MSECISLVHIIHYKPGILPFTHSSPPRHVNNIHMDQLLPTMIQMTPYEVLSPTPHSVSRNRKGVGTSSLWVTGSEKDHLKTPTQKRGQYCTQI